MSGSRGVPGRGVVRLRRWGIPILVLLCLTLPHLEQGDFRVDTGRYAAVGLQMWRTGDLLTPYLQEGRPYFNKPPLVLWIHGLVLHVFGVSLIAARLPTVLAAAGCVAALMGLLRRFHNANTAMVAGLVLATTYEFFRRTREISLDVWQVLFMLLALWALALAVDTDNTDRSPRRLSLGGWGGWWWSVLGGGAIGLALMTKPLMGLLVLPIGAGWLLAIGRWRVLVPWLVGGGLGALVVGAPWHLAMWRLHGEAFTSNYFGAEVVDRAAGEHQRFPWWEYLKILGTTYWPWLLFVVIAGVGWATGTLRVRTHRGLVLALLWTGVWLVLLSVFPDKRPRYAVLLYPGLAWVCAAALVSGSNAALRRGSRRWLVPAVGTMVLVAVVLSVLPVRLQAPPNPMWGRVYDLIDARRSDDPESRVIALRLDSNEEGKLYLSGRGWPENLGLEGMPAREDLPVGTLLIDRVWDRQPKPHEGEAVVLHEGTLAVYERVEPGASEE